MHYRSISDIPLEKGHYLENSELCKTEYLKLHTKKNLSIGD